MSFLRELSRGIVELLYPGMCGLCGGNVPADAVDFCAACRQQLTHDSASTCPRCAATVGPFVNLEGGCVHCRADHFHFERAVRLGPYEGLLRTAILRMKHDSGEALAERLGRLWSAHAAERLRGLAADVVMPVPLHWWRRWARGYNQSEVLARVLGVSLGLPVDTRRLRRVRPTPPQTRQTPAQRRLNVRGAFRAGLGLKGRSVLLVDDVLTTGSTCSEAARALRDGGAERVMVAVLAKSQN